MAQRNSGSAGETDLRAGVAITICALIVSIGINFTRVPIIYAFRLMTCDDYYARHPSPALLLSAPTTPRNDADPCAIPEVEAATAAAVSVLGATVTVNGVVNLVVTGWSLRTLPIRSVLVVQQLLVPALRLGVQLVGVAAVGARAGIYVVEAAQLLGVVGGSTGYVLVLTTFLSRVTAPGGAQTLAFGYLQGAIMLGTAVAHLAGGVVADLWGVAASFEVACAVMGLAVVYSQFALPSLPPVNGGGGGGGHSDGDGDGCAAAAAAAAENKGEEGVLAKMINPIRALMSTESPSDGARTYQRPLIAMGVFIGVLATGFIPVLLQMYSTNQFGFTARQNGYLMALTFGVRSLFLSLGFPRIISAGRRLIDARGFRTRQNQRGKLPHSDTGGVVNVDEAAMLPQPLDESAPLLGPQPPANKQQQPVETTFDLYFLIASFFADAVLTAATAMAREGWHLYVAAAVLPLASGSAPAAKGVLVSICRPEDRADVLGGIATVEMIASVITMAIFGPIFSAFASIGMSNIVFFINGALAFIAGLILLPVRLRV